MVKGIRLDEEGNGSHELASPPAWSAGGNKKSGKASAGSHQLPNEVIMVEAI